MRSDGFFFRPYKRDAPQVDLSKIKNVTTDHWGVTFMMPEKVAELLPHSLRIVRRSIARTGNRHDAYVVQKV